MLENLFAQAAQEQTFLWLTAGGFGLGLLVQAACALLAPGGIVTVCIYPGHEEGRRELAALDRFAASLSPRAYNVLRHEFMNGPDNTPQLLLIQRNT